MRIRVLLACGDPSLTKGLRAALATARDFAVCGTAKCIIETIQKAKKLKPNLIIFDRAAVPREIISAAQVLKRTWPDVGLFLVAAKPGMTTEKEALEHGIDAVFARGHDFEPLIENARDACNGLSRSEITQKAASARRISR